MFPALAFMPARNSLAEFYLRIKVYLASPYLLFHPRFSNSPHLVITSRSSPLFFIFIPYAAFSFWG